MNKLFLIVMTAAVVSILTGCVSTDEAMQSPSPALSATAFDETGDEPQSLDDLKAEYFRARKAYMSAKLAAKNETPSEKVKQGVAKRNKTAGNRNAALKVEAPKALQSMTDKQKKYFEKRRIVRSRDTTSIPGSVIVQYERNGRIEQTVTNVLHAVKGAVQNNPIAVELESKKLDVAALQERIAEWESSFMDAEEIRAKMEAYRDKAKLASTKAIINEVIKAVFGEDED